MLLSKNKSLATLLLLVAVHLALADRFHPDNDFRDGEIRFSPNPAELTAEYWREEAQAALRARRTSPWDTDGSGSARNVVMFLGDGMSVTTLAAARALLGQRRGRPGEESQLAFESFPSVGLSKVKILLSYYISRATVNFNIVFVSRLTAWTHKLQTPRAQPRPTCAAPRQIVAQWD